MPTNGEFRDPSIVRFPIELRLNEPDNDCLSNAVEAVKREYRESVKWKRLRCRRVTPIVERDEEAIFILEVGQAIQFDWTWEGAVAFRPFDLDGFDGNLDTSEDFHQTGESNGDGSTWSGEVVEVDETNGRIFVWVSDPDSPPRVGSFYVRPFEFLAFLHSVYSDPSFAEVQEMLRGRLHATRGEVHPKVNSPVEGGLPQLRSVWEHAWGVLWGPPGTGKTFTIGQHVAACLHHRSERILVVSTTNKATDEVALSIGRAARSLTAGLEEGTVLRIGKSANHEMFKKDDLEVVLKGTETDFLRQIAALTKDLHRAQTHEERAVIRKEIQSLRRQMKDASFNIFVSEDVPVVVATAFKATTLLNDRDICSIISEGNAPFTTIVIDEAGLISRAGAAALSLLASRRVLLVGDSKQLAPISRISRILPTTQATWLASSGLSHLRTLVQTNSAVHLLREQHRMHPHVCAVVSAYQYDNELLTAQSVHDREFVMPDLLTEHPRSIWYVLDEDGDDLPSIRAERGPGNRSWVRPKTRRVLKKLFADEKIRQFRGLFITPFVAQARDIRSFLAEEGLESWSAATVHSQQGTEADCVIFDTVNAGSCGWPYDEWKRLINVGLSRAREFLLVMASRAEMREPYLKSLMFDMDPKIVKWLGNSYKLVEVPAEVEYDVPDEIAENPDLIGNQLTKRKELRPVFSFEQQRLCGLKMDGKPRLVRGVAGSGKTVVLAHWLLKTMQQLKDQTETKIWAVFANRSLQKLITDTIEDAWELEGDGSVFPWDCIELCHIKDVLQLLLPTARLRMQQFEFDYDAASAAFLTRRSAEEIEPLCHAMFIDEAQDMGPNTLRLLSSLVSQSDVDEPNSRSVNIFYDNAQNIYGRGTPKWSEMGLDMRGRSSVMKESFRSTRPISEFALNVLYRLKPPGSDADHAELIQRNLVEETHRNGSKWWNVRFNQVDGPVPIFRKFADRDREIEAIGRQIVKWIRDEGVRPSDICILYNGQNIGNRIERDLGKCLPKIDCHVARQTSKSFDDDPYAVRVTTSHSYKGYDSEIVVIAGVDKFVAKNVGVLANNLYVAMTRARSILAVYGMQRQSPVAAQLLSVLDDCLNLLCDRSEIERESSKVDDVEEIVRRLGNEHRSWLVGLWNNYDIVQEPILAVDGEIITEPLFWLKHGERVLACYGTEAPSQREQFHLEDAGIEVLEPGVTVE